MAKTEAISLKESSRLVTLEKVVSKGLSSFIEVGNALPSLKTTR